MDILKRSYKIEVRLVMEICACFIFVGSNFYVSYFYECEVCVNNAKNSVAQTILDLRYMVRERCLNFVSVLAFGFQEN